MNERVSQTIKATWLSRRPKSDSYLIAFIFSAGLFLTSFLFLLTPPEVQDLLTASKAGLAQGKIWQIFTATLVHSDQEHFLTNGVGFAGLTYLIYGYYGMRPLLVLIFALASLTNLLTVFTYDPETHLLGASGAVYAMGAFWLILYFLIDRRHSLGKRLLRSLGFALIAFVPSNFEPPVSYTAHAIAFILGSSYALFFFKNNRQAFRLAEEIEKEAEIDPFFFQ